MYLWELEVTTVKLKNIASYWLTQQVHPIANPTRNDAYLVGSNKKPPQLSLDIERSMLGYYQEIAVGTVECFVRIHVFARGINVHAYPRLHRRITSACNKMQAMNPIDSLIKVKRVPPQLVWDLMEPIPRLVLGVRVECGMLSRLERSVSRSRQYAIQPGLLILMSRSRECGAR